MITTTKVILYDCVKSIVVTADLIVITNDFTVIANDFNIITRYYYKFC